MEELDVTARQIGDPDPRRRMEAVRRLARFAGAASDDRAKALELLGRLVDDEADFVRWNVAMALGQLGDPAGLPLLRTLAVDAHANVRLRVALAVALIGDPAGVDVLVEGDFAAPVSTKSKMMARPPARRTRYASRRKASLSGAWHTLS